MAHAPFTPSGFMLTSKQGMERVEIALKTWHLQGRFNINIAAGSMNVLYDSMQKDKLLSMVNFLRGSQNVDQLELDKRIIAAHGEANPDSLLKAAASVDAAKAAELENQMFFAMQFDPGVTPGEDHQTHIKLQNPTAIQQHPRFAQLAPEMKSLVLRLAQQHTAQHENQLTQEGARFTQSVAPTNSPQSIQEAVQSSAQHTQDAVSNTVGSNNSDGTVY